MEHLTTVKLTIIAVFGAFGSYLVNLFGGWTTDMKTLIILMIVDFTMGLIIAGVFKNSGKSKTGALSSNAGWKGLCKKGVILMMVLVATRLDIELGTIYIRPAVIIGFSANEGISIIENAGLMGIPLPKQLTKAIEVLKNKEIGETK